MIELKTKFPGQGNRGACEINTDKNNVTITNVPFGKDKEGASEFNLQSIILLPPDAFDKAKVYSALLSIVNEPPDKQPVKMVDLRNRELTQELMGNVQKIVKGTAEDSASS